MPSSVVRAHASTASTTATSSAVHGGLTANTGGRPITERRTTLEDWLNPAFNLTEVIRTLSSVGAVTVPGVLRDAGLQQLIEQTVRLPFTDQPAVVGPRSNDGGLVGKR